VARVRIILHGKAAGNAGVRTAVHGLRQERHIVEVRVTWETGDAQRLTAEAVAEAGGGKIVDIPAPSSSNVNALSPSFMNRIR